MKTIHSIYIGQPQTLTDEKGTWQSSIFRQQVDGPILVEERGLAGDQVTDTKNHGSPDQAVCCHPMEHYGYWNDFFELTGTERELGPGSVGENWTLLDADEAEICVGDIYAVGEARVQVSAPRYPCTKQDRKLQIRGLRKQTAATMRAGFYVRVLTEGTVEAGQSLQLESRLHPTLTIQATNVAVHRPLDRDLINEHLAVPELATGWKKLLRMKLGGRLG